MKSLGEREREYEEARRRIYGDEEGKSKGRGGGKVASREKVVVGGEGVRAPKGPTEGGGFGAGRGKAR